MEGFQAGTGRELGLLLKEVEHAVASFAYYDVKMSVTRSAATTRVREQRMVKDTFAAVRDSGRRMSVETATGTARISTSGTARKVTAVNDAPSDPGGNLATSCTNQAMAATMRGAIKPSTSTGLNFDRIADDILCSRAQRRRSAARATLPSLPRLC